MVIGIVILAPESLPVTVKVACNVELEPNNVFTVVALTLTVVPITVFETLVPNVCVEFNSEAFGVLTPTPSNVFIVLTSEIVAF